MTKTVIPFLAGPDQEAFQWIDLANPSLRELKELAKQFQLHATSVQDCMDPAHLPKFEAIGKTAFIIARAFDETTRGKPGDEADTILELTRKVALFVGEGFILSVHRKDQPFLKELRERLAAFAQEHPGELNKAQCVHEILKAIFLTYAGPVNEGLAHLEDLEVKVFRDRSPNLIEQTYYLKRRAFVYRRVLRLSLEVIQRCALDPQGLFKGAFSTLVQDVKEEVERIQLYSEELLENSNTLLELHLSLESQRTNEASHRTNEVMRLLTVLSVLFLPLNFIASIFGMNFEFMPELHHPHGYPAVLTAMAALAGSILWWFWRRGWLSRPK